MVMSQTRPLVYVPMAVDIVHPGHINIIKKAAELGEVMVGLFTDEAISTYKNPPYMDYATRKIVIENIKGVSQVVPQLTRDYEENLRKYQPRYMVPTGERARWPMCGPKPLPFWQSGAARLWSRSIQRIFLPL